jgi:sialic acid synthase SpsE
VNLGGFETDDRVLVIAEIGVNHDGSVERAVDLIAHAKAAGADAVKLQVFRADALVHHSAGFAEYQKSRVAAADPAEMLRQYELSDDALGVTARAAADAGLILISTPFSPDDVPRAAAVSAVIKIASPDLINRLLLRRVVETRLPMIVSTGAATEEEIDGAVRWLHAKAAQFALLHCISSYPVAESEANLCWISGLARHGVPVGYSDHTTELSAGALAVACGARIVEKHITYDTAAAGPDHSASFDPPTFTEYVRRIRQAERMLGGAGRRVLACERDVRTVSRQSLVLRRDLPAGHTLTADDLTTQRPGTAMSAEHFESAVGRTLVTAKRAGDLLMPGDLGDAA